jgi:hypothetical protein
LQVRLSSLAVAEFVRILEFGCHTAEFSRILRPVPVRLESLTYGSIVKPAGSSVNPLEF